MEDTMYNFKKQIIQQLNLLDKKPEDIDDDMPLFGNEGLGLDSIDALEIVVILEKHYGIQIESADEIAPYLKSVRTLATFANENRTI